MSGSGIERKLSRTVTPSADVISPEKVEGVNLHSKRLSRVELREIRECFDMFDIDQDGRISADEIATMTRALGQNPTDAEIMDMIEEVDKDGNGFIEWHEFLQLMKGRLKSDATVSKDMTEAFKVFDKDRSGTIDLEELRSVLTQIGETMTDEEVEDMFEAADINHDGSLDYAEFVELMCGGSIFD